jgi:hypothetical protein
VLSFDGDGAGPLASTVELTNSVVSGFVKDLRRFGNGILTANWSRFATGDGPSSGADNTSAAPGFVNPGARDFRLAAGSPLIDAGDPAPFGIGGLLTDLNGAPRPLNGEGDCSSARRDMGAFEFQPGQRAPIDLTASAAAGSASTGEPVGFSASACDPDGDPLTYSWRFDDGSTASGASVSKSFATGGTHTGTVTASDGANTATKAATVQVVAPTQSLLSFSMLRDSFAVGSAATPITGAAKKPKRGSAFRFKLAIAGDITITVDALLSGRVSKGKCVSPTRALRNAKRCTRVVKKGAFRRTGKAGDNSVSFSGRIGTKALAPGSYRATLAAIGTQSRSVRFKIVRG